MLSLNFGIIFDPFSPYVFSQFQNSGSKVIYHQPEDMN